MSHRDLDVKAAAADVPRSIDMDAGRRAFMRSIGFGAAGAAMLAGAGLTPAMAQNGFVDPSAPTDTDILNFALNLEYLEAEYYLRAAFGRGLADSDTTGRGTRGGVTGGRKVNFDTPVFRQYAEEIARDEEAHVKFLRSALGDARVARPKLDLRDSFTSAARAAGLIGPGQSFDPYANENAFLLGAFIFEDVGVTAYKGAARLIDNKDILEAAAGLLAVEAYHAGEVRTLLISRRLFTEANKISNARDSLDGNSDLDQGITRNGVVNVVPTDSNGLAFSRTPAQVRNIVYLGGAANDFGFFPNRLNGSFR